MEVQEEERLRARRELGREMDSSWDSSERSFAFAPKTGSFGIAIDEGGDGDGDLASHPLASTSSKTGQPSSIKTKLLIYYWSDVIAPRHTIVKNCGLLAQASRLSANVAEDWHVIDDIKFLRILED